MHSPHRTSRPASLRRLLGLALVQTLLFTLIPTLAWGTTMVVSDRLLLPSADDSPAPHRVLAPATEADPEARRLLRLMTRLDCSTGGLGDGVIPAHALVRRDGTVSVTSFDLGWAVYSGEAPGALIAVCRR